MMRVTSKFYNTRPSYPVLRKELINTLPRSLHRTTSRNMMQYIKRIFQNARENAVKVTRTMMLLAIVQLTNYAALWYNNASFVSLILAYLFVVGGKTYICGHSVYTSRISRWQIVMFFLACVSGFNVGALLVVLLPYAYAVHRNKINVEKHAEMLITISLMQIIGDQYMLQVLTVIFSFVTSKHDTYLIFLIFINSFAIASIQNSMMFAILVVGSLAMVGLFVSAPKNFTTKDSKIIKLWGIYRAAVLICALVTLKWYEYSFLICHFVYMTTALSFYRNTRVNPDSFYVTWCEKMNFTVDGRVLIDRESYQIVLTPLATAFCAANICVFHVTDTDRDLYIDFIKQNGITDDAQISACITSFSDAIVVLPSPSSIEIKSIFTNRHNLTDKLVQLFYKKIMVTNVGVRFDMSPDSIKIDKNSFQMIDIYMMVKGLLQTKSVTSDIGLVILKFMMCANLKPYESSLLSFENE